jgi:hypothetical protein
MKVEAQKVVELLNKSGLKPNPLKVEEFVSNFETVKNFLYGQVIKIYQGSRPLPRIIVNPYTDHSFWNFEINYINIGLLSYPVKVKTDIQLKEFALSLLGHELSHTENTPNISMDKEIISNPILMTLFNIFEDQRIEFLMADKIGKEVFIKKNAHHYEAYYLKENKEEEKIYHLNPFNIIILKRWERWSPRIKIKWEYLKEAEDKLKDALEQGYIKDIEAVLDIMESKVEGEIAVKVVKQFYERWSWLYDQQDLESIRDPEGGSGEREEEQGLNKEARQWIEKEIEKGDKENPFNSNGNKIGRNGNPLTTNKKNQWLNHWLEVYKPQQAEVLKWKNKLKKELARLCKKKTKKERDWTKKRLDIKVAITGIPKKPFHKKVEKVNGKIQVIIDGSSSMWEKFQKAVNIAEVFRQLCKATIYITTSEGLLKVEKRAYPFPGGGTALSVAKPYLKKEITTIVITDGSVDYEEKKFLKEVKEQGGLVFIV